MRRDLLKPIVVAAFLAAAGGCPSIPTHCHPSMVEEDGGGIYFKRDADGGGRYFQRDGGGRYFHRDDSDGDRQGICRGGVLFRESEAQDR